MFFVIDSLPDVSKNPVLLFMKKHMSITNELHDQRFALRLPDPNNSNKLKLWFTPLFVCLVLVEIADLIFAVDSVPAIFAITTDPYIVYTSNIFAILGLRALYFALDAVIHRFKYLKYALAMTLIFIGSKIFIADLMGLEKFPAALSLGITVGLILMGITYSLYKTRKLEA